MIKCILFDVDNTLYSSRYGLEEQVVVRIGHYLARKYGINVEEAVAERKRRVANFGTTIEWLIAEKGFTEVEDYYRTIHPENEADVLAPDAILKEFLENIPCKKAIMTNAPLEHALRVLKHLDIESCFGEIFDIRRLGFRGKPREDAFRDVLNTLGAVPEEVLFVDDVPRYVGGFLAIGGRGVLLDEQDLHPAYDGVKIRDVKQITQFLTA